MTRLARGRDRPCCSADVKSRDKSTQAASSKWARSGELSTRGWVTMNCKTQESTRGDIKDPRTGEPCHVNYPAGRCEVSSAHTGP